MKTKQEQIEEIKQVLIKTCKRCRPFEEDYMQSRYAEALYNAGYRKTFTSELASDRQKAFKEGYSKGVDYGIEFGKALLYKTRKETAKEILQEFREIKWGQSEIDNVCIRLAEKYGVEVDE